MTSAHLPVGVHHLHGRITVCTPATLQKLAIVGNQPRKGIGRQGRRFRPRRARCNITSQFAGSHFTLGEVLSYRQTHSRVGSVYRFSPRAKSSGTVQLAKINTHVTSSRQCTRRPGAAAPFVQVQQAARVHVGIGSDVTVNKQGLSTPLLLSACQDYLALMSFCYGKGKGSSVFRPYYRHFS